MPTMKQKRAVKFSLFTLVVVTIALFLGGWRTFTTDIAQIDPLASPSNLYLPIIFNRFECNSPTIAFDYVPPYGSDDNLRGHVTCVIPTDYKVAVYINVSGWWTKPYYASPLTPIQSDGTWITDINTGGSDNLATEIAAFLVPNGYTPPQMSGGATLPEELYSQSVAFTSVTRRAVRTITFSGYTWNVKYTPILAGPGPNYFSDDPADVWVDEHGYLHLNIVYRDGIWYSTEVICNKILQYGKYTITLGSRVDLLDKNAVFGFFSWDDKASQYNYREIDVEFSRWGEDTALNAQYVVQPWDVSGNRHRFTMDLSGEDSIHRFDWRPDRIQFDSWNGNSSLLQTWTYTNITNIPPAGAGNARINLWLFNGQAPSNSQNVEVIIKSFQFEPANP
jgi:hypothetical protein